VRNDLANAAAALGRKGGLAKSAAKAKAAALNLKKARAVKKSQKTEEK
jgi:hypothetical protein